MTTAIPIAGGDGCGFPTSPTREGSFDAADPGRATGVDLGADPGKAQVGGRHVRPAGRADPLRVAGAVLSQPPTSGRLRDARGGWLKFNRLTVPCHERNGDFASPTSRRQVTPGVGR